MDPRKFDYLESIREKIESGDLVELDEYLQDIRIRVQNDPHFTELFEEIQSNKLDDAISLIDEIIFEDMQSEFEEFYQGSGEELSRNRGEEDDDLGFGTGDDEGEQITFEPFDEESYYAGGDDDY